MPEIREVVNNSEIPQESVETRIRPEKIIDLKQEVTIPREVKTWMQKLEEDPSLNQDDSGGGQNNDDSVLKPIATAVPKITLPTNRTSFTGGFSKPVDQAWRWLSEFVLRIIKKSEGKVKFKEE